MHGAEEGSILTAKGFNAAIQIVKVVVHPSKNFVNCFFGSLQCNRLNNGRAVPAVVTDECVSLRGCVNVLDQKLHRGVFGIGGECLPAEKSLCANIQELRRLLFDEICTVNL